MINRLLAENPLRSRADLQRAMRDLFNPVRPFFSPGRARVVLPASTGAHYSEGAAQLEAFSRLLWGLGPLAAGDGEFADWELYQRGLENGTDPRSPDYWALDSKQSFVEMAAIAVGLCLVPGVLWEPLAAPAKRRLTAWLGAINGADLAVCNWRFFRVLTNLGLRAVRAAEFDPDRLADDLASIDRQYLGQGWYADGIGGQRDYYVPVAMHFFGLLYARLAAGADPGCARVFKERAAEFSADFIYWFAADGSAIPYGRSLTYRFAQGCFWAGLAFADVDAPFGPGIIKGLLLRHLRWWLDRPVFTETGLLTVGYAYPNLHMAENYNAPGSPYWALKSFLPLALPADGPFWSAEEEELPDDLAAVREMPHARMILCRNGRRTGAVALCAGQSPEFPRHSAEKYAKFAYSTAFGFNVPTEPLSLSCRAHDSTLALSEDGRYWRVRGPSEQCRLEAGRLVTRWWPWPDVEITSFLQPFGRWHVRVHRVQTGHRLLTAEGGFPASFSLAAQSDGGANWQVGADFACVPEKGNFSGIRDLLGGRSGENVVADPNANLLTPKSVIPTLRGELPVGETWLACAVLGSLDDEGPSEWQREITIDFDGSNFQTLERRAE